VKSHDASSRLIAGQHAKTETICLTIPSSTEGPCGKLPLGLRNDMILKMVEPIQEK
jgi:hypothetical protein